MGIRPKAVARSNHSSYESMRIILHIGTEKTGTTTLQRALFENQHVLRRQGVAYIHGGNGTTAQDLAAASLPNDVSDNFFINHGIDTLHERTRFRDKVLREYSCQLEAASRDVDTAVISSEFFHSRLQTAGAIDQLRCLVAPFAGNVRVVCYLRRQVDMVVSHYSTVLRGGGHPSFIEHVERLLKPEQYYCNYKKLLETWEKVFGRKALIVKRFDRNMLHERGIVDDFMAVCELPIAGIEKRPDNANESVNHVGQVLLRELNRSVADNSSAEESANLRRVRHGIAKAFSGKGQQLPPAQAKELQSQFDTLNDAVRTRWFPGESRLFSNKFPNEQSLMLSEEQDECFKNVVALAATQGRYSGSLREYNAYADILRDSAELVVQHDKHKAYGLLKLANMIRPHGGLIRKRLSRLEEEINQKE